MGLNACSAEINKANTVTNGCEGCALLPPSVSHHHCMISHQNSGNTDNGDCEVVQTAHEVVPSFQLAGSVLVMNSVNLYVCEVSKQYSNTAALGSTCSDVGSTAQLIPYTPPSGLHHTQLDKTTTATSSPCTGTKTLCPRSFTLHPLNVLFKAQAAPVPSCLVAQTPPLPQPQHSPVPAPPPPPPVPDSLPSSGAGHGPGHS